MKKFLLITISLIIAISLSAPLVNAQTTTTKKLPPPDDCGKLATVQTGLTVILEEPIGGENPTYCFRVCDREISGGKRVCTIKVACTENFPKTPFICQRIQIIQATSGTELIYSYVGTIYKWAAATIGIVTVLIIVGSGIMIISSAGNTEVIGKAKSAIVRSLLGLVILFLSGLILYTINPTFFV